MAPDQMPGITFHFHFLKLHQRRPFGLFMRDEKSRPALPLVSLPPDEQGHDAIGNI
jgi:hypothetical protein